jgi:hypothetical protein
MTSAKLLEILRSCDGAGTAALERVVKSLPRSDAVVSTLVGAAIRHPNASTSVAATWILLRMARGDAARIGCAGTLSVATISRLCELLAKTDQWQTRLHVLQLCDHADVVHGLDARRRMALARAALRVVDDPKPFVRAWALSLLARLGGTLAVSLRKVIVDRIAEAEQTAAGSVRARLRQVRKSGGLAWMEPPSPGQPRPRRAG